MGQCRVVLAEESGLGQWLWARLQSGELRHPAVPSARTLLDRGPRGLVLHAPRVRELGLKTGVDPAGERPTPPPPRPTTEGAATNPTRFLLLLLAWGASVFRPGHSCCPPVRAIAGSKLRTWVGVGFSKRSAWSALITAPRSWTKAVV